MTHPPFPIEAYLPHRGAMLLLSAILDAAPESFTASVLITLDSAFYVPDAGVPSYAGMEYMAQTIAAWDGAQRLSNGLPPEIGLLLGARDYQATQDYFENGACLIIRVAEVFSADGMSAFDCTIHVKDALCETHVKDALCARATLNVYRPQSA
jgi:predicted hotdog family 3-hydroxylacyl-ACP dehydratase